MADNPFDLKYFSLVIQLGKNHVSSIQTLVKYKKFREMYSNKIH